MKILVTGAYGYIGSHTVKKLVQLGHHVTALDNKVTSNNIKKYAHNIIIDDISKPLFWYGRYDHIVHLAGAISVEESENKPWKYVSRNIVSTQGALNDSLYYPDNINITLSSTASAFTPVSVYAQTKLLAEKIVRQTANNYTILRFFNVAGNDGEFKQIGKPTHLIRIAAEAAAGKRPFIQINGTDWNTPDGTCLRDYVHVLDVVNGIVKSINEPANNSYNCIASGKGYSVREVIETMKKVSKIDFKVIEGPRREGDADIILMPREQENYVVPQYSLEDMCLSAYNMELAIK